MVVTCTEPELVGEQRVPPLTSVPPEELTGGGGGNESGGCTSPSSVPQDSRGGCKRELATVELQEADSTMEGVEVGGWHAPCHSQGRVTSVCVCMWPLQDDSETPTKKTKWDLTSPGHSPQASARDSEMDTTLEGLPTEALPMGGSTEALPMGGSTDALSMGESTDALPVGGSTDAPPVGESIEVLPVGGSTASPKGHAPTGECGHGDMGLDVSVPGHSAPQTCSEVEELDKQQPMEVGEAVDGSASDTEVIQPADRAHLA